MTKYDVIVIGAGAAGLFCAIEAGKRGRKVLVVERADKAGKKILISGGGRCNFTNTGVTYKSFLSENSEFCRSALSRFTQQNFIELVERYAIDYYEKKDGQLFCRESARQILSMLLSECEQYDVQIITNTQIENILKENSYTVVTSKGQFESKSLVISTGGPSIPKMGATDFGYKVAKQFGLSVLEPRPALVPLTFNFKKYPFFVDLTGIALHATVRCGDVAFSDNILFTHKGLSGPAILQISSYWKFGKQIEIDLLPGVSIIDLWSANKKRHHKKIANLLSESIPQRLAVAWCELNNIDEYFDQLSLAKVAELESMLHHWQLTPTGTEGYEKAEVTIGGVNTDELSSKTMESKKIKDLYFIGEVVDVTGWLGGYNFQWAWSSGWAAGQFV